MNKHRLWMVALQWKMLTRFAGDLPLSPGASRMDEAARYLCYYPCFGPDRWREVESFARANRAELEGAEIDARVGRFADPDMADGTEFDASTVAQQFRLLFGFAAQYTVKAAELAHLFLITHHNLGTLECAAVNEFLDAQEVWRTEEETPVSFM